MAGAFSKNRLLAVLAYPTALLSLTPYAFRRQLYEAKDGNGMVVFGPYIPLKDVLIMAATMAGLFLAWMSLMHYLPQPIPEALLSIVAIAFLAGIVILGNGSLGLPVGAETPRGNRVQVSALIRKFQNTS